MVYKEGALSKRMLWYALIKVSTLEYCLLMENGKCEIILFATTSVYIEFQLVDISSSYDNIVCQKYMYVYKYVCKLCK